MNAALNNLVLATGRTHLGDLCWWSLADASIDRQSLESKWRNTGLPMSMAGASTMAIKELAGHQQIPTTQKYMHLAPAAKSVAIALLDKGADLMAAGPSEADQKALADVEVRGDAGETDLA